MDIRNAEKVILEHRISVEKITIHLPRHHCAKTLSNGSHMYQCGSPFDDDYVFVWGFVFFCPTREFFAHLGKSLFKTKCLKQTVKHVSNLNMFRDAIRYHLSRHTR